MMNGFWLSQQGVIELLGHSLVHFDYINHDINKYRNFESRQYQSISAKFSDWGSHCSPQCEASDQLLLIIVNLSLRYTTRTCKEIDIYICILSPDISRCDKNIYPMPYKSIFYHIVKKSNEINWAIGGNKHYLLTLSHSNKTSKMESYVLSLQGGATLQLEYKMWPNFIFIIWQK